MGRFVSRARQIRLNHQAKEGRTIPVEAVSEEAGVDRGALTRLELNRLERVDLTIIARLCEYYGVSIGDILVYQAEDTPIEPIPTRRRKQARTDG